MKKLYFGAIFLLLITAGLSIYFIYHHFSQALGFIDVRITMNKHQALEAAKQIAQERSLGPTIYTQSALFTQDTDIQNYIEYECGGQSAFTQLIKDKLYYPFTWRVRHFQELDPHECTFIFTPEGDPYGFISHLDQNQEGAALEQKEAQKLAEQWISKNWDVDLAKYTCIETSHEMQPNKRIDHTFTYERKDCVLGQSHYRISVTVSGDKVTSLYHYMDIPETFEQTYAHLRSTNESISSFARICIYLLYLCLGCIGGLLFLFVTGYAEIKKALYVGLVLTGALAITLISRLPTIWFSYNTSYTMHSFALQNIIHMMAHLVLQFALYTITFCVAEGLTRKLFTNGMQFFKTFTRPPTAQSLILTIMSYLIVPLFIAYVVGFYIIATNHFHWWMPSSMATDPNIISYLTPGLSSFCQALIAGAWEECFFRAIPIAGCALLFERFGKRNLGLIVGFILQIIVFGAAHANYPTLPGYARLVELIIPSTMFGLLYIFFGLIPGIIVHVAYDAILMALPVFISDAPGLLSQKIVVILLMALPLIYILISWLKARRMKPITPDQLNGAWQPAPGSDWLQTQGDTPAEEQPLHQQASNLSRVALIALALIGIFGLLYHNQRAEKKIVVPSIEITKNQATAIAKKYLSEQSINIDDTWHLSATIYPQYDQVKPLYEFIEKQPREIIEKTLGSYAITPQWLVRICRFNGSNEEKALQYVVYIAPNGTVNRLKVKLPQEQAGQSYSESEARKIAQDAIKKAYPLAWPNVHEISAISTKHPARIDWTFTYHDSSLELLEGQTRVSCTLSSNHIDSMQHIYTNESYQREIQQKELYASIIAVILLLTQCGLLAWCGAHILFNFKKHILRMKIPLILSLIVLGCSLLYIVLNIPLYIAGFTTNKPLISQLWVTLLYQLVSAIMSSLIIFCYGIVVFGDTIRKRSLIWTVFSGAIIAIGITGMALIAKKLFMPTAIIVPNYIGVGSINQTLSMLAYYLTDTISMSMVMLALATLALSTLAGKKFSLRSVIASLIAACMLTGSFIDAGLTTWLTLTIISALVIQVMFQLMIRYNPAMIIFTVMCLNILAISMNMRTSTYIGSTLDGTLSIALIASIGLGLWYLVTRKKS